MVKPGAINKKKNVFHGNHKSKKRRALKGRAVELPENVVLTRTQQRKRLTNPNANVNFSKKKNRLLNKRKGTTADDDDDDDDDAMDVMVDADSSNAFGSAGGSTFADADVKPLATGGTTLGGPR